MQRGGVNSNMKLVSAGFILVRPTKLSTQSKSKLLNVEAVLTLTQIVIFV